MSSHPPGLSAQTVGLAIALFGDAPDGVLLHADGAIVFCNRQAVKLLGARSWRDLCGHSPLEFYGDDEYEVALERLQTMAFTSARAVYRRHWIQRLDGKTIELDVSALRIPTPSGSLIVEVIRQPTSERGSWQRAPARHASFRPTPVRATSSARPPSQSAAGEGSGTGSPP